MKGAVDVCKLEAILLSTLWLIFLPTIDEAFIHVLPLGNTAHNFKKDHLWFKRRSSLQWLPIFEICYQLKVIKLHQSGAPLFFAALCFLIYSIFKKEVCFNWYFYQFNMGIKFYLILANLFMLFIKLLWNSFLYSREDA